MKEYYTYIGYDAQNVPRYVGYGSGKRFEHCFNGKSHNKLVNRVPLRVEIIPANGIIEAKAEEIILIAKFGRLSKKTGTLYNFTDGGDGGDTISGLSKEKKKIRALKISKANKGKKKSPEHCKNLSLAKTGQNVGELNPMFGKTQSVAGKQRIGAAAKVRMTGRIVKSETREKLRKNATGVTFSEKRKDNISLSKVGTKKQVQPDGTWKYVQPVVGGAL